MSDPRAARAAALAAAQQAESGQQADAYAAAARDILGRAAALKEAAQAAAKAAGAQAEPGLAAASRAELDELPNVRDLAAVCPGVQPGRLLRSACPPCTPAALRILLAQGANGVRTFIDLREEKEDRLLGNEALWARQTHAPPHLIALLRTVHADDASVEAYLAQAEKELAEAPSVADVLQGSQATAQRAETATDERHVKYYVPYTNRKAMYAAERREEGGKVEEKDGGTRRVRRGAANRRGPQLCSSLCMTTGRAPSFRNSAWATRSTLQAAI